jgi:hypothetical protein
MVLIVTVTSQLCNCSSASCRGLQAQHGPSRNDILQETSWRWASRSSARSHVNDAWIHTVPVPIIWCRVV